MAVEIAGTYMDRSLTDFQQACEVYIEREQGTLAPDTALLALLCDAVRLARELRHADAARNDLTRRLIEAKAALLRYHTPAVPQAPALGA